MVRWHLGWADKWQCAHLVGRRMRSPKGLANAEGKHLLGKRKKG